MGKCIRERLGCEEGKKENLKKWFEQGFFLREITKSFLCVYPKQTHQDPET